MSEQELVGFEAECLECGLTVLSYDSDVQRWCTRCNKMRTFTIRKLGVIEEKPEDGVV